MSIDDYTGIRENAKQHPLDFIRTNLERIPDSMNDEDMIDTIVEDITLTDVYNYISYIEDNQSLSSKPLKISYVRIDTLNKFELLCDNLFINQVRLPKKREQRVYFVEWADFATTIIPIEIGGGKLNIFMQPLESCPDLITEMWAELQDKGKKIDLALKKAWELNPTKKPNN
jgi:hypothetical protein